MSYYLDLNWQFGSYDNFCDSGRGGSRRESPMVLNEERQPHNQLRLFVNHLGIPTAIDDEQSRTPTFHKGR